MTANRLAKSQLVQVHPQSHRPATRSLLLLLATTVLLFLSSSPKAQSPSSQQPIELSFSLERKTITLHEPVVVRLRAENESGRPVRLHLGFDRVGNLRFMITGPGKKSIQVAPRCHGGIARPGTVMVAPGETYTQNVLLNPLYPFPQKGRYLIQVSLVPHDATGREGQPSAYKSQEMSLRLLPRNRSQLKKVCEGLVEKIMSGNAAPALESAKTLSFVNDPVAVPYLERVATHGPFKPVVRQIAIHGLARISLEWGEKRVFSLLAQKDPRLESEISAAIAVIRTHEDAPLD